MKAATAADLARLLIDQPSRCTVNDIIVNADGAVRMVIEITPKPTSKNGVLTLVASDGIAPKDYVG